MINYYTPHALKSGHHRHTPLSISEITDTVQWGRCSSPTPCSWSQVRLTCICVYRHDPLLVTTQPACSIQHPEVQVMTILHHAGQLSTILELKTTGCHCVIILWGWILIHNSICQRYSLVLKFIWCTFPPIFTTILLCDNQGTISCIHDPHVHTWMKHINIHAHFIHDCVNKKLIDVVYISNQSNIADLLTKPLSKVLQNHWCNLLWLNCGQGECWRMTPTHRRRAEWRWWLDRYKCDLVMEASP